MTNVVEDARAALMEELLERGYENIRLYLKSVSYREEYKQYGFSVIAENHFGASAVQYINQDMYVVNKNDEWIIV